MRMKTSGVTIATALAFLLLGVMFAVLRQTQPERIVPTGQAYTTAEPDYDRVVIHETVTISPMIRTHWSTTVAHVTVESIEGPYFNTPSGLKPTGNYEDFDEANSSPFDEANTSVTDEPDWQSHADETAEAWTASGKEVPEWEIFRLAVLDVADVLKGAETTEKLVVILPGGRITDTMSDEIYQSTYAGLDDLVVGDESYVFTSDLYDWQISHAAAYPIYERCLDRAEALTGLGDEALCQLLGASYLVFDGVVSNIELPANLQVSALQTEVAKAVSTQPVNSALVYTDSRRSNWPIPSPTPTP